MCPLCVSFCVGSSYCLLHPAPAWFVTLSSQSTCPLVLSWFNPLSPLRPPPTPSPNVGLVSPLSGWVPAVELVGPMAGVTAGLSGVACDQGGCRTARTIGAERLRLTAGYLSRAISVGAEARSQLVGHAYCEDQRQSVSTLHSALAPSLSLSFVSSTALPPNLTLSSPSRSLLHLYPLHFSPVVLLQLFG